MLIVNNSHHYNNAKCKDQQNPCKLLLRNCDFLNLGHCHFVEPHLLLHSRLAKQLLLMHNQFEKLVAGESEEDREVVEGGDGAGLEVLESSAQGLLRYIIQRRDDHRI